MEISSMINLKMTYFKRNQNPYSIKTALAVTDVIQGTSRDKIYQELGLESLKS